MTKHSKTEPDSVAFGSAVVPLHDDGGWALPGGGRTTDRQVAVAVAQHLDQSITKRGGLDRACRGLKTNKRARRR